MAKSTLTNADDPGSGWGRHAGGLARGAVLLFLFSLSHALEHLSSWGTSGARPALMKLTPMKPRSFDKGSSKRFPLASSLSMIASWYGRRTIPADGVVLEGHTVVDQSPMTGESIPVERQVGDPRSSQRTMNQHGVEVEKLSRIASGNDVGTDGRHGGVTDQERAVSQQFTEWFGQKYTWIVLVRTAVVY